jgi:hypothetical protein
MMIERNERCELYQGMFIELQQSKKECFGNEREDYDSVK